MLSSVLLFCGYQTIRFENRSSITTRGAATSLGSPAVRWQQSWSLNLPSQNWDTSCSWKLLTCTLIIQTVGLELVLTTSCWSLNFNDPQLSWLDFYYPLAAVVHTALQFPSKPVMTHFMQEWSNLLSWTVRFNSASGFDKLSLYTFLSRASVMDIMSRFNRWLC